MRPRLGKSRHRNANVYQVSCRPNCWLLGEEQKDGESISTSRPSTLDYCFACVDGVLGLRVIWARNRALEKVK